jgi:hypothetical protein
MPRDSNRSLGTPRSAVGPTQVASIDLRYKQTCRDFHCKGSGAARTAPIEPVVPPAPTVLLTTIRWTSVRDMCSPMMRADTSVPSPAETGPSWCWVASGRFTPSRSDRPHERQGAYQAEKFGGLEISSLSRPIAMKLHQANHSAEGARMAGVGPTRTEGWASIIGGSLSISGPAVGRFCATRISIGVLCGLRGVIGALP